MVRRYKVRDILQLLRKDGWVPLRSKGSHRQFAHPIKEGVVTVSYHASNEELHPKTIASIFRQAGFKGGSKGK
jgi:predicted RNA binding protein YcfA (HicA-like mRNA interferase family)